MTYPQDGTNVSSNSLGTMVSSYFAVLRKISRLGDSHGSSRKKPGLVP